MTRPCEDSCRCMYCDEPFSWAGGPAPRLVESLKELREEHRREERLYVVMALEATGWQPYRAAKVMKCCAQTLWQTIKQDRRWPGLRAEYERRRPEKDWRNKASIKGVAARKEGKVQK